jgi:hypothetical protein
MASRDANSLTSAMARGLPFLRSRSYFDAAGNSSVTFERSISLIVFDPSSVERMVIAGLVGLPWAITLAGTDTISFFPCKNCTCTSEPMPFQRTVYSPGCKCVPEMTTRFCHERGSLIA